MEPCPSNICKDGLVGYDYAKQDCEICKGKGKISSKVFEKYEHNEKVDKQLMEERRKIWEKYRVQYDKLQKMEQKEMIALVSRFDKRFKK